MIIAVFIAFAGLLYAYKFVRTLIEKLLIYAEDCRIANNEKTDVIIAVNNDLKAPLKVLRDGMYKFANSADNALEGAVVETAKGCFNAAKTIDKLIEEITDFSKYGFIRTNIKREFIDLRDIIQTEVDSVAQLTKKKNLNLQCSFVTGNTKLWGDKKKLSRVVMNLLANAIKYTPEGATVNITVLSNENTVQFFTKNIDYRILSDETAKISEKSEGPDNYSGAKDIMAEFSIVKDIVDMHNGHITVNSDTAGEVEFKIVLPRDLRMIRGLQEARHEIAEKESLTNMNIAETINQKLKMLISSPKADAGNMELKREYIEISPLIDEAISNYEMKLSEKRVTMEKYIPKDICAFWADRIKLKAVIFNLLSNAIKNTPPGGKIAIKLTVSENEICFEISDGGANLDKKNLEKLFDSNLFIARNIVELHKGKIWAESEPGKGSRFIFTLPKDLRKGRSRPISQ